MSKQVADGLKRITTSLLRKYGYFKGYQSGIITWTGGYDGHQNRVSVSVTTNDGEGTLCIQYTQTLYSGEKKEHDDKIPIISTPCRYGGRRYWFRCPWYANGRYCGRRVANLYLGDEVFACRHCYNLTYESRNVGGRFKAFGSVISVPDLEEMEAKLKRWTYRGRPTKKYKRYQRLSEKAELQIIAISMALGTYRKGVQ